METTIFLAKFWGWLLVIISLIFLFKKRTFLEEIYRLAEDKGFALLSGYVAFIVGLMTVILHNVWVADWRVIITVFGWISLIKGVTRIGFPGFMQKFTTLFKNSPMLIRFMLVIMIFLGVWLVWMGR